MNQHLTSLRGYQKTAITNVYESMRNNRKVMLQLPTGSGKSHIAAAIMEQGLAKGRRIGFLVDRIVLGDQITDRLIDAQLPVSVMQGDHPLYNPNKPIQICSIQTLARRKRDRWPEVDLFIMDEAHMKYAAVNTIMDTWDRVPWIGLSATPFTRGLGLIWQDLVVGITTREMIEQGFLSEYKAYGPSSPDLVGVRRSGNDYSPRDLEERMNCITGDIVRHYLDRGKGMKGLAFTPTVAYAQYLAEEFQKHGVAADHVSAHDTDEQRYRKMQDYKAGRIQMMCNCEVLTKGFDDSEIGYGILARPTRSLTMHIQMMGRFLRKSQSIDTKIIMDHASNIERLGFPDDDLPQRLDFNVPGENSDTRDEDEPEPWNCPMCHSLVPPRTPMCPSCGHMARRATEVEQVGGVLQELTNPNVSAMQNKQDVYSQLLDIANQRGYAKGWVSNKYRKLFEVWPRQMLDVATPASERLKKWITSENIRYAKRRDQ